MSKNNSLESGRPEKTNKFRRKLNNRQKYMHYKAIGPGNCTNLRRKCNFPEM